jgi:AcrR family transcriptional regulator
MTRRGQQLREHILWAAKDVFLEMGYERTSMDAVAVRAETSKRSLYAYFESKEKLFGDVVGLVRELSLRNLKTPAEYGADPAEAVVRYCGRFVQMQLWQSVLRTLRLGIAEAERLPEAAATYHEAVFTIPEQRLADYLVAQYGLDAAAGGEIARRMFGRALYPQLIRALFGVDEPLLGRPDETSMAADVDLEAIRTAAAELLP